MHGIHIVVRGLDYVASISCGLSLPTSLTSRFVRSVYVDESVEFLETARTNSDLRLEALVHGVVVTKVHITGARRAGTSFPIFSSQWRQSRLSQTDVRRNVCPCWLSRFGATADQRMPCLYARSGSRALMSRWECLIRRTRVLLWETTLNKSCARLRCHKEICGSQKETGRLG